MLWIGDPDPDSTFYIDDDPDPHPDLTPRFIHVGKSELFVTFITPLPVDVSLHLSSVSMVLYCYCFQYLGHHIEIFLRFSGNPVVFLYIWLKWIQKRIHIWLKWIQIRIIILYIERIRFRSLSCQNCKISRNFSVKVAKHNQFLKVN